MARPEDSRVKIPALVHFTRICYTYMSIKHLDRNVDYDGDTNIFYELFQSAVNRINDLQLSLDEVKKIWNYFNPLRAVHRSYLYSVDDSAKI